MTCIGYALLVVATLTADSECLIVPSLFLIAGALCVLKGVMNE